MQLNKIHKQFHSTLFNYVIHRVKDRDDAADILQEIFIKIAYKIDTLKDEEKLKSWIFTIARNSIIDYYRKNGKTQNHDLTDNLAETTISKEDPDVTKGLDKCLKGFIQKLPEEYKHIIIDSEIKGIKQKDLAEKYAMAYPSVRSRVQRGRKQLKELLLSCCKIEADSRGNILQSTQKDNCGDVCGTCD